MSNLLVLLGGPTACRHGSPWDRRVAEARDIEKARGPYDTGLFALMIYERIPGKKEEQEIEGAGREKDIQIIPVA